MATTKGKIENISLTEDFCCVRVLETEEENTSFILLWSYFVQEDNATNRLNHGMFLSLVRDAFLNNRTVEFTHDSGSALATIVHVE